MIELRRNGLSGLWYLALGAAGFAAFVGVNACAIVACEAIKYPELGRDSGLMALWFMAAMLGGIVWCVSAGISLLILRVKSRRSPVVRP
jgi:hypothetical protein